MVPDKFNMVDMGGIDLIMMQGEAVPGLYDKLMAAISNCRYQCLYNWMFNGVLIPPTYVQIEVDDGEVYLNEGVSVTSDDVIHIYSIEPAPPEPEIIPLLAEENGVYNVPTGKDGFNPVTVDVPSYTPVINPLTVTENGIYTPTSGVDGFSPVTVNVSSGSTVDICSVFTGSYGGNDASIYLVKLRMADTGITILEPLYNLSFLPFYQGQIDHYDFGDMIRIRYVSPLWYVDAIGDRKAFYGMYNTSSSGSYTAGQNIFSWNYQYCASVIVK